MKELVIFDLDGTLNESRMPPDHEMVTLLCELLSKTKVAIMSGASFAQLNKQFLGSFNCDNKKLSQLSLVLSNGSSLYQYKQHEWEAIYKELLSATEKEKIYSAFKMAVSDGSIGAPKHQFGKTIEDRGNEITYSALGQNAPIDLKKKWDPDYKKREKIRKALLSYIPEFEVQIGGSTSIDITKKGINKAYGIQKLKENLDISREDMLFIGNAVFLGGNDYSVKEAGVETIQVLKPEETKKIIRELLKVK